MNRLSGFTLIELVIVLALLAILAAVAVPRFVDLADSARQATARSELGSLRAAAQLWYASQAVAGSPAFPASRALLTARLDQAATQLCNTGFAGCVAGVTSFSWLYNSTTGAVTETGGMGWNW